MPKIQKFQQPTKNGIQYNPLTPAQAYVQSTTNYFGQNFGTNSTSSYSIGKKNPIFKNGVLDLNALSQFTNLKLQTPPMTSSIFSALNVDPVSAAAKEGGKGFLSGKGATSAGAFGKANAD
jgi:hypothetical protein